MRRRQTLVFLCNFEFIYIGEDNSTCGATDLEGLALSAITQSDIYVIDNIELRSHKVHWSGPNLNFVCKNT